jgi:hypothetical protein
MISLREIRLYICQRIQSSPSISSSSICFFIFFSATPFTSFVLPGSPWPDRERIHVGSTPESTRRPSPTCIDRNLQGRVLALPDEFVDVGLVRTETAIRQSGSSTHRPDFSLMHRHRRPEKPKDCSSLVY